MAATPVHQRGLAVKAPIRERKRGGPGRSPTRSFLVLGVEGQGSWQRPVAPTAKDVIAGGTAGSATAVPAGATPAAGDAASGTRGPGRAVRPAGTRDNRNA